MLLISPTNNLRCSLVILSNWLISLWLFMWVCHVIAIKFVWSNLKTSNLLTKNQLMHWCHALCLCVFYFWWNLVLFLIKTIFSSILVENFTKTMLQPKKVYIAHSALTHTAANTQIRERPFFGFYKLFWMKLLTFETEPKWRLFSWSSLVFSTKLLELETESIWRPFFVFS